MLILITKKQHTFENLIIATLNEVQNLKIKSIDKKELLNWAEQQFNDRIKPIKNKYKIVAFARVIIDLKEKVESLKKEK